MNHLQIMLTARGNISTPEKWCKGQRQNMSGAYCALGAVDAVVGESDEHPVVVLLAAALTPEDKAKEPPRFYGTYGKEGEPAGTVAKFNNATDHASVLSMFDRAIERQRLIDGMQETALAPVEKELAD